MARQQQSQALTWEIPVPPGPIDRKQGKTQHLEHVFRKTKMCAFYQRGQCNTGRDCAFAHGEEELHVRPDLTKTVMCTGWLRRRSCREGKNCTFAHGQEELRRQPPKDSHRRNGPRLRTNRGNSHKGSTSSDDSGTTRSNSYEASAFSGDSEDSQYHNGPSQRTTHGNSYVGRTFSGDSEDAHDRNGHSRQTTPSNSYEGSAYSGDSEEAHLMVLQHLYELSDEEMKLVEVALGGSDEVQRRACCKVLEEKLQLAAPAFYED